MCRDFVVTAVAPGASPGLGALCHMSLSLSHPVSYHMFSCFVNTADNRSLKTFVFVCVCVCVCVYVKISALNYHRMLWIGYAVAHEEQGGTLQDNLPFQKGYSIFKWRRHFLLLSR